MIIIHDINILADGRVDGAFNVRQNDKNSHELRFALPLTASDAAARLKLLSNGQSLPYLYDCAFDGQRATCTPSSAAWQIAGRALLQLEVYTDTAILWQSQSFVVLVEPSLDPTGGITPEEGETWYDKLNAAAENANDAAGDAREAMEDLEALHVWENYDPAKTYVPLNKVAYNGSSYLCVAETTGNAPPNETYWLVIAQKGRDGTGAEGSVFAVNTVEPDASGNVSLTAADIPFDAGASIADEIADVRGLTENKADIIPAFPVTLPPSWTQDGEKYTQTITIPGLSTAADILHTANPTVASQSTWASNGVYMDDVVTADTAVFWAATQPTEAISVIIKQEVVAWQQP